MFTLDQVVPWGRSFEEYEKMFALSEGDLAQRVLGCADGPASFNAQATARGMEVISCDPLYGFGGSQIRHRIDVTYEMVMEETRRNQDEFVWQTIPSLAELGRLRMGAMQRFLADYEGGKREGRYVEAALPTLPFADDSFDLALCSHFLFLYSEHFSESFHRAAIIEICRVAQEVRIFPLLALGSRPSPYVESISESLSSAGIEVSIERVPYEFQCGGNQMMRVYG